MLRMKQKKNSYFFVLSENEIKDKKNMRKEVGLQRDLIDVKEESEYEIKVSEDSILKIFSDERAILFSTDGESIIDLTKYKDMDINDLNLDTRTYNVLQRRLNHNIIFNKNNNEEVVEKFSEQYEGDIYIKSIIINLVAKSQLFSNEGSKLYQFGKSCAEDLYSKLDKIDERLSYIVSNNFTLKDENIYIKKDILDYVSILDDDLKIRINKMSYEDVDENMNIIQKDEMKALNEDDLEQLKLCVDVRKNIDYVLSGKYEREVVERKLQREQEFDEENQIDDMDI